MSTTARFSFSMMSAGVPAGANKPNHDITKKPVRPLSDTVGMSGSSRLRVAAVVARPFKLPDFTCGKTVGILSNSKEI